MDPYLYMIMILIEVCADAGGMGFQLSGTIAGGVTGSALPGSFSHTCDR